MRPRLSDAPFEVRMEAAIRLAQKEPDEGEREKLFLAALLGHEPSGDDLEHLMACHDPHCSRCTHLDLNERGNTNGF